MTLQRNQTFATFTEYQFHPGGCMALWWCISFGAVLVDYFISGKVIRRGLVLGVIASCYLLDRPIYLAIRPLTMFEEGWAFPTSLDGFFVFVIAMAGSTVILYGGTKCLVGIYERAVNAASLAHGYYAESLSPSMVRAVAVFIFLIGREGALFFIDDMLVEAYEREQRFSEERAQRNFVQAIAGETIPLLWLKLEITCSRKIHGALSWFKRR